MSCISFLERSEQPNEETRIRNSKHKQINGARGTQLPSCILSRLKKGALHSFVVTDIRHIYTEQKKLFTFRRDKSGIAGTSVIISVSH